MYVVYAHLEDESNFRRRFFTKYSYDVSIFNLHQVSYKLKQVVVVVYCRKSTGVID